MNQALIDRSFDFAIRIIELNRYLQDEGEEFVIANKLLACGTEIGLLTKQSSAKEGEKNTSLLNTVLSRAKESEYLLELLVLTGYLTENQGTHIRSDCKKIIEIISELKKKP